MLHFGQERGRNGLLRDRFLGTVELVHKFHDGGDASIEVPAALKIVANALDGLVKFALDLACRWRKGRCRRQRRRTRSRGGARGISYYEAVHAAQESLDALDAGVLPVHVAVGRDGEQDVQARGIGAAPRAHFIRRYHIPAALGPCRALISDRAPPEETRNRLVVGDEAQIAHELGPETRVNKMQNGVLDSSDI